MSATGLTVRYVVTSGDAHHLYLEDWLEEETFAATKFFMTGVKFPTTRNGKKLLAKPQHKVRIELVSLLLNPRWRTAPTGSVC